MRWCASAVLGLFALLASCGRATPRQFTVVAEWPHDTGAYTQGLVYHDGVLYESTGRYGESELRRVEPETGRVLHRVPLPDDRFGEGIAIVDDRLYQLTWKAGVAYVYAFPSLEVVDSLRYEGEGWGLAWDGESLIMSDGTAELRFLDPADFTVRRTVTVTSDGRPLSQINELEMIDGELWANVYQSDYIVRIDPETGEVRRWIDLDGLLPDELRHATIDVLNGIAYDASGDRLLVTGKYWPRLYQIRIDAGSNEVSTGA